jgi:TfoX/Sxy family transcriptional regulator of competence genes
MPFDPTLAARIRILLARQRGITEQKMFGGLAFLRRGSMCCGVLGNALVLRLGNDGVEQALRQPHTRPMNFTGKSIKSMLYIDPPALTTDAELRSWIKQALTFVTALPPTKKRRNPSTPRRPTRRSAAR